MRSFVFPDRCCACGGVAPEAKFSLIRQVGRLVYAVEAPVCRQCQSGYRRQKLLGVAMAAATLIGGGGLAYGLAGLLKGIADPRVVFVVGLVAAVAAAFWIGIRSDRNPPAWYKASFSWGQPPPPTLHFRNDEFQREFNRVNGIEG